MRVKAQSTMKVKIVDVQAGKLTNYVTAEVTYPGQETMRRTLHPHDTLEVTVEVDIDTDDHEKWDVLEIVK